MSFVPPTEGAFDAPFVRLKVNLKWVGYIIGRMESMLNDSFWDGDETTIFTAVQAVENLFNALALGNLMSDTPVGSMVSFAGTTAPDDWLLCDGSNVNEVDYPELATVLTPVAGIIALPDFRGRVPVGAGTGTGLTNRTLLSTFGNETHTLTINEMPAHDHPQKVRRTATTTGTNDRVMTYGSGGTDGLTNNTIDDAGGGAAHNNMQPSLVVNVIIKARS